MSKPVIILGNGGHASVVYETLLLNNIEVAGFTGPDSSHRFSTDLPYLGQDEIVNEYGHDEIALVNGLGSTGNTRLRAGLCSQFQFMNYTHLDVLHPSAIFSDSSKRGEGLQMMAGSIVNPGCQIGENVLINTGAIIEHHCVIEDHCHIAPGAVICGSVSIGQCVHVGAGAVILQNLSIGDHCVIAAGSVVTDNVRPLTMVAGVPAVEKKTLSEEDY